LLAYDAFQGPTRTHEQRSLKARADSIESLFRYLATTYPTPPYTPEDLENVRKERDSKLAALLAEGDASELKHRLLVEKLAFWGFVLVSVGSSAQAIGALLS
jgi:hypothetical protein